MHRNSTIRSFADLRMVVLILAVVVVWQYGSGCDEMLPEREEPVKIFVAAVRGQYIYRITANGMGVMLKIMNLYEETLQGTVSLSGAVDIRWDRHTEYSRTIPIDDFTMTHAGTIDPRTGVMTIDPGDSLTFFYLWDFMTNDSVFIPTMFRYDVDQTCPRGAENLQVTNRMEIFTFTGNIKILDKVGYTLIDRSSFNLCHYATFWVEVKYCPNNEAGRPCPQ